MSDRFDIALCYVLDGAVDDWAVSASRFLASYQRCESGRDHAFYPVLRCFDDGEKREHAQSLFETIPHSEFVVSDASDEVGIYRSVVATVPESALCFVCADCEILGDLWLAKLAVNLETPDVGIVGIVGSYRSSETEGGVQRFPNVHLCTDVWAIRRSLLLDILRDVAPGVKLSREEFESGRTSLTERITSRQKKVLVVGRNGRGYEPQWWPRSETYYRGTQSNLLISTKRSRAFDTMRWNDKFLAAQDVWGIYIDDSSVNLLA